MKPINDKTINNEKPLEKRNPFGFQALRTVIRLLIPLMFLSTGLILLFLAIPGWSLIIGLPTTIFGIVFLLYAYDELSSQINFDEDQERKRLQK